MIRCKNSLKHAQTNAPPSRSCTVRGDIAFVNEYFPSCLRGIQYLLSWGIFFRGALALVGYLLSPTVSEVASKGGRSGR